MSILAVNALAVNVLAVNSVSQGVSHICQWICAFLDGFYGFLVTEARSPCFPRSVEWREFLEGILWEERLHVRQRAVQRWRKTRGCFYRL